MGREISSSFVDVGCIFIDVPEYKTQKHIIINETIIIDNLTLLIFSFIYTQITPLMGIVIYMLNDIIIMNIIINKKFTVIIKVSLYLPIYFVILYI